MYEEEESLSNLRLEFERVIKCLKNGKSPGIDNIMDEIIKV